MSDYRVADGHDMALGSLTVIAPQPTSIGIQATRRVQSANGGVLDQGKYIDLVWDVLPLSVYQALLTTFGVRDALTNEVTVYVPDETGTYVRMNGLAVRPEAGRDVRRRDYFIRDLVILVRDLATAS